MSATDYRSGAIGIVPAAPDDPRMPAPQGGCTPEQWRGLNTWKWHLVQRDIDPRCAEWPGWGYIPTETAGAALLTDIELARLAFYRHEFERGALSEWGV